MAGQSEQAISRPVTGRVPADGGWEWAEADGSAAALCVSGVGGLRMTGDGVSTSSDTGTGEPVSGIQPHDVN